MQTRTNTPLGVALNVIGSGFFAIMFAYTALLGDLDGEEIYGWRMLVTFPLLTIFILANGNWPQVVTIFERVLSFDLIFIITRFLTSFLIGVQLWLFLWAPANDYGLAVSLGYFMLPITLVLVGRLAFNDQMSRFQKLACFFAVLGILNQLLISKTLAWPTLMVCLGYPIYFWLRQKTETNNIGGVWFDIMLSLPLSLYFILESGHILDELAVTSELLWLVMGLGLISVLALAFQSLSAPHLNLSLFGLLVYVEPVLLVLVAVLLGETIAAKEWPTYIAIWLAVIVLMLEGYLSLKKVKY